MTDREEPVADVLTEEEHAQDMAVIEKALRAYFKRPGAAALTFEAGKRVMRMQDDRRALRARVEQLAEWKRKAVPLLRILVTCDFDSRPAEETKAEASTLLPGEPTDG
jgi:hypothetical protein